MNDNERKELEMSVRRQEYIKVLNKTRMWTWEEHQEMMQRRIRQRIREMERERSKKHVLKNLPQ